MKNILAQVHYNPYVDWDDAVDTLSIAAGSRIWYERDGKSVNLLTDGNIEEVKQNILEKADMILLHNTFMALLTEMKWEQNAQLN